MSIQTSSALRAAWQPAPRGALSKPRLVVAGATGVLGNEVLRRLAGSGRFAQTLVLAKEPIVTSIAQVSIHEVSGDVQTWQPMANGHRADVGVVMFEPPRLYYQRERALWTPAPEQLLALAHWLKGTSINSFVGRIASLGGARNPHVHKYVPVCSAPSA